MTTPDVGWYQLTFTYNNETVTTITNLDIMCMTRSPGWQEIHTTVYLDFLVLSFFKSHKLKFIIYTVTTKSSYPRDNSIIVRIYQEKKV